jgi:hypothetical protein
MSEYFVGTTGSNSQTTFEALTTSEVLDDLGLNTSDAPTFSGLFLDGSGSTIFSVDGSNGRLFGVTDEVTGTVFSVNDAAGLPIVEVESTSDFDKITLGEYGSDLLVLSGQTTAEVTGSQIATQSWISDQGFSADTNYFLTGIEKSSNTLNFKVRGSSEVSYTFGSNAFNSTTIPSAANDATITISAGTALGGGGNFTTDQSANETITINHDSISRSDTTSSVSLDFGDTVTGIDSITSNAQGHITAENTVTYTLPSLTSGDITGALGYTPVTLEDDGSIEAEEFIGDLRGAVSFKAQAGEAIAKGEAVFISGISGNTTVVGLADANDATRMPAFGIASEAASANNPVTVINFGSLGGLDTDTPNWDEGDELYVSNTAGALTTTPPTSESSLLQKIAKVTRRDNAAGSITVMGAGRTNAVPNLNEGRLFVGNSSNQAVADDTAYVDIANSRVGIGTTSPSRPLDVESAATSVIANFKYTGAGYSSIDLSNTAGSARLSSLNNDLLLSPAGTERMRIKSSGNVGIGTNTPDVRLELRREDSGDLFELNRPASTVSALYGGVAGNHPYLYSNNSIFTLGVNNPDGGTGGEVSYITMRNGSTRYTTFEAGNVGIGTTSPNKNLTIAYSESSTNRSNTLSGATAGSGLLINNTSSANGSYANLDFRSGSADGRILYSYNGTGNSGDFHFITDDTASFGTKLFIGDSGNVGIGTTSPDQKLHVLKGSAGTITSNPDAIITAENSQAGYIQLLVPNANESGVLFGNVSSSASGGIIYNNSGTSNGLQFRTNGNSTKMAITSSGNVGIGTTNPIGKLTVSADGGTGLEIQTQDSLARVAMVGYDRADSAYRELYFEGYNFNFNTSGTNTRLSILNNGNVGIGDTTPSYKLDVNGTLRATGAATFDSNVTVTGDLTVNGTTTTINSTTVQVDDKNIELGTVASPTDATADGGGITLKGATDKTINWVNSTDSWTSNQNFSAPSLTLTSLSNQASEATALMINGSNVVGTRELSTSAFVDSSEFASASHTHAAGDITSGTLNAARLPRPINGDWWNGGAVIVGTDGVMEVGKYLDFHTADSGGGTDYDVRVTASNNAISVGGSLTATSLIKYGGTSSEFLKADGSVDSNTYLTTGSASSTYLPLAGGELTGDLTLDDGSGATPSLYFKNGDDNFWRFLMESGGNFSVKEGTSSRLTFKAGGSVGIGTTSPVGMLSVVNPQANTNTWTPTNKPDLWVSNAGTSNAYYAFGITTSSGDILSVTNAGNVGIGTTSPNVSIQAESNSSQDKRTLRLAYDSSYYFDIANLGSGGVHYNAVNAGAGGHKFQIDGSEKVRISYAGNVGIGVTSPISKLHVYQNDAATSTTAGITIEQDSTGDAQLQFLLTGAYRWVQGIDNSDGDKFKIGTTGTDITITTSFC